MMMRMMRRWLSRQGWPLLSRLAKEDAPAALRGRAGARYPRIIAVAAGGVIRQRDDDI
jgi:hypothetical protein